MKLLVIGFPRSARILRGVDFKRVFADPRRLHGRYLSVLFRSREQADPGASVSIGEKTPVDPEHRVQARLGMALAKKKLRSAVLRNRVRRIAREAFRLRRETLPAVDIVLLARNECAQATASELRRDLDRLLGSVR